MNTQQAIANNLAAQASGATPRVFDWVKAAQILKERQPDVASAGLQYDWWWTAGEIWRNGSPELDSYTYLASNWATPLLVIGDEEIECWRYVTDTPGWNAGTTWPPEALAVLHEEASE